MDPNQIPQVPQQQGPNPYDFLNAAGPQKKPLLNLSGGKKSKVTLSILFLVTLLVIGIVGFKLFSSATKKDYSAYQTLLTKQTELIRVANMGSDKARATTIQNYMATIESMTISEKSQTLSLVKKSGLKIDEKILNAKKDADNDKLLASAEKANLYDEKIVELVNSLIIDYHKSIKTTSGVATTKTEKALVKTLQTNAAVIVNAPKSE